MGISGLNILKLSKKYSNYKQRSKHNYSGTKLFKSIDFHLNKRVNQCSLSTQLSHKHNNREIVGHMPLVKVNILLGKQ